MNQTPTMPDLGPNVARTIDLIGLLSSFIEQVATLLDEPVFGVKAAVWK
jgi:hypothetical protein